MPEGERTQWWEALRQALPADDWIDARDDPGGAASGAEVAVVADPQPGRIASYARLRLVQSLWAGVDRLLAGSDMPADVPVARMVDPAMGRAMAETACWAVLSLHRHAFDYASQQQRAQWRPLAQRRADEVAVLVLGLGEMGAGAARRLAAMGYDVRGWSARPRTLEGVSSCAGGAALPGALASAEIVVNLLPLTPRTSGLFDAARLAGMRPGASLVNLGRGGHVVERDLLAALDAGHLHRAVLDVFATEPLPAAHPFWSHPRVTVMPHVAALTDLRSAVVVVHENVEALRQGRPLCHLVDRLRGY